MTTQVRLCTLAFAIGWIVGAVPAEAAPTLAAPYGPLSYSISNLNSVPGVPGPYGGLTLEQGDPNTLLIGGNANNGAGAIYSIGLTRDASGHISGFSGTATPFASAPFIDGGLAYGPGGVLFYTAYSDNAASNNRVGEIKPGSTSPDKVVDLTPLGVFSSVGTLAFVPAGQPGAGNFKIASFDGGQFYNATLSPDGSGTYNITSATQTTVPGRGPEGISYVPTGSPLFSQPSLLLSEYRGGTVARLPRRSQRGSDRGLPPGFHHRIDRRGGGLHRPADRRLPLFHVRGREPGDRGPRFRGFRGGRARTLHARHGGHRRPNRPRRRCSEGAEAGLESVARGRSRPGGIDRPQGPLRGYPRCFPRNYKGLRRISNHRCVVLILEFQRTTASGHIKHIV